MRGGFVTGARYLLLDNDQLGLRPSGLSQVLQNFDAVFARPIVKNPAKEENCDIFLPRWLRVKETATLRSPNISPRLRGRRG
jgi:hypothetical protein